MDARSRWQFTKSTQLCQSTPCVHSKRRSARRTSGSGLAIFSWTLRRHRAGACGDRSLWRPCVYRFAAIARGGHSHGTGSVTTERARFDPLPRRVPHRSWSRSWSRHCRRRDPIHASAVAGCVADRCPDGLGCLAGERVRLRSSARHLGMRSDDGKKEVPDREKATRPRLFCVRGTGNQVVGFIRTRRRFKRVNTATGWKEARSRWIKRFSMTSDVLIGKSAARGPSLRQARSFSLRAMRLILFWA